MAHAAGSKVTASSAAYVSGDIAIGQPGMGGQLQTSCSRAHPTARAMSRQGRAALMGSFYRVVRRTPGKKTCARSWGA